MTDSTYTLGENACLFHADCRDALRALPSDCIDSVVTDPPYALVSVVKRFGGANAAPAQYGKDGAFARQSAGFMNARWDTGEVAFDPGFWAEVLRVLKPGGHVVAMGGTRTYHRLACGVEDAGFEIRDSLMWVYGTGFNKKGYIRDTAGEIVAEGWAGALKPAFEPIVLARKPLSEKTVALNMVRWGTGALNIGACRVPMSVSDQKNALECVGGFNNTQSIGGDGILGGGETMDRAAAYDPSKGRWPANLVHDSSEEVLTAFPQSVARPVGSVIKKASSKGGKRSASIGAESREAGSVMLTYGDEGSAARFFYSAKASRSDRAGSKHPTVKPISLMSWLCRLITPPGGVVLDPFAGSGTTGAAALQNGFKCLLVEREAEYVLDIVRRLASPPLVPHQSMRLHGEQ